MYNIVGLGQISKDLHFSVQDKCIFNGSKKEDYGKKMFISFQVLYTRPGDPNTTGTCQLSLSFRTLVHHHKGYILAK